MLARRPDPAVPRDPGHGAVVLGSDRLGPAASTAVLSRAEESTSPRGEVHDGGWSGFVSFDHA